MKNKLHNSYAILKYLMDTERFKIIFFVTIILALYGTGVLGIKVNNFSDTILTIFQFPIFNIILFLMVFFNTLSICSIFSKEFDFYLMRKKSKKDATKEIMCFALVYNIIYFVMLFVMIISFCLLLKGRNLSDTPYLHYSISNNLYMLFYIIRYFLILSLISLLNVILYQKIKWKVLCINLVFIIGLLIYPNNGDTKGIINVIPWNYFSSVSYSTFSSELVSTLLFLIILEVLIIFCLNYLYRRKKLK